MCILGAKRQYYCCTGIGALALGAPNTHYAARRPCSVKLFLKTGGADVSVARVTEDQVGCGGNLSGRNVIGKVAQMNNPCSERLSSRAISSMSASAAPALSSSPARGSLPLPS